MSHRFFKNQNAVPASGWVGESCGQPVKGGTFGKLVSAVRDLAVANNCPVAYEDEVARGICSANPGFCWKQSTGEPSVAAVQSVAEVVKAPRRVGCGRCGGGRAR
jgi:hypothetical protein